MSNFSVMNVSHYKREFNNFHQIIENGFGPDIYLFVQFITPAIVIINGVEHITDKNACIIYTPGQRQEYKHYNGLYLNAFLIFKTTDPYFLETYALPQNQIFYITNTTEISVYLEKITYSITDKLINREEETERFTLKFFEKLSESCIDNIPNQKRIFEGKQRFIALRDEVRKNPGEWTVLKMAKHAWFTRSRFSVLYTSYFDITPRDDLLFFKVEYAKKLLEETVLPIADISAKCGYSNVAHFIRIFNKHLKITPLQYRKNYEKGK